MSLKNEPFGLTKIIKFWFPVVLYSGIIFWVSSLPKIKPPIEGFNVDKVLHILEYIPFGYLVARALFNTKSNINTKSIVLYAAVIAFFYGLTDEFHQSFVDNRHATIFDVIADTIGGLIGGWIFNRFNKDTYKG